MIVVKGAGSPAEINLRQGDITNMSFAEAADCPVIKQLCALPSLPTGPCEA
ncbi:MAG: hypothetical protein U5M23_01685 [Marinagarivorans sp.]|nr:hypothetical protein [Marinagarivorans sp.]